MQSPSTIDTDLARLNALATDADIFRRFYLAEEDVALRDLEDTLANQGGTAEMHDALLATYRDWRGTMHPEDWAAVVAYNAGLSDADRNWIISEEMTEISVGRGA